MKLKYLIFPLLLVFALNAYAVTVDLPNFINFYEEPVTVNFFVENDSGSIQALNISVFSPLAYEIKGQKSFLEAGEKVLIELVFFPKEELINSVYESSVLIELGNEKTKKNFSMYFMKRNFCPMEFNAEQKDNLIEVKVKNNSFYKTELEILGLKSKENWSIEKKVFSFDAGEEKIISFSASGFGSEENSVLIKCNGIEEEFKVKLESSNINVIAATGNVFLAELGELTEPVNLVLLLIASVLLILFISRLVKRLNKEEN